MVEGVTREVQQDKSNRRKLNKENVETQNEPVETIITFMNLMIVKQL